MNILGQHFDFVLEKGGVDNLVRRGISPFCFSEQKYQEIFNDILRKKGKCVAFDIGGYIGTHSVLFCLAGATEVHTFEPSPQNYKRIRKVCAKLNKIIIHEVALSDSDSRKTCKINNCNTITQNLSEYLSEEIVFVNTETFLTKLPDPDYIKVDIEGMESRVFRNMDRYIFQVKPIWEIELHPGRKFENDLDWLSREHGGFDFDIFRKDYNIFLIKNGSFVPISSIYDNLSHSNIICFPK